MIDTPRSDGRPSTTAAPVPRLGEQSSRVGRMLAGSPDAEQLQGRRAGVVTRSTAFVIDFFCVIIGYPLIMWSFAVVEAVFTFSTPTYPDLPPEVSAVLYAVWTPLYFSGGWLLSGRTIGQAILGLRVVGRTAVSFGPVRAILRFWVLFATLLVAPAWLAMSRSRLGLHDRATRTQVVYDARSRRTVVDVALGPNPPLGEGPTPPDDHA